MTATPEQEAGFGNRAGLNRALGDRSSPDRERVRLTQATAIPPNEQAVKSLGGADRPHVNLRALRSPTAIPESANTVSRPLLLNAAATDNVNSKKKSLFKPAP